MDFTICAGGKAVTQNSPEIPLAGNPDLRHDRDDPTVLRCQQQGVPVRCIKGIGRRYQRMGKKRRQENEKESESKKRFSGMTDKFHEHPPWLSDLFFYLWTGLLQKEEIRIRNAETEQVIRRAVLF
jgi:hypothetical protein